MLKPTEYRGRDRRARPGGTERRGRPLVRATLGAPLGRAQVANVARHGWPYGRLAAPSPRRTTRAAWPFQGGLPRAAEPRTAWGGSARLQPAFRPRLRLVVSNAEVAPAQRGSRAVLRLVSIRRPLAVVRARQRAHQARVLAPEPVIGRRTGEYIFVLGLAATGLVALVTSLRQILGG